MARTCATVIAAALCVAAVGAAADPLEKAPSRYAKLDGMKVDYKSLG